MLTIFAVAFLFVFAGILVGAAVVEMQKKRFARNHGRPTWPPPRKRQRNG